MKLAVKYISVLAILILCFSFSSVPGDWVSITPKEANDAFIEINNEINSIPSFSVNVIQRTFQSHTTTKWAFQYEGFVRKEGNNYHTLLMDLHTIQNNKYKIIVDTVKKIILVSNPDKQVDFGSISPQTEKALESAMKVRHKTDHEKYHMEFTYPDSYPYHKIDMIYNKSKFPVSFNLFLNKSITSKSGSTEVTDKPRIEINYNDFKKEQKFAKTEFSEKKYFTEVNNKITLSQRYKTYKLKDLRVQTQK